ncbi:type I restriction-modification system subunit M [Cellulosimicrobium cellulans]|uniref:type I restriction-modification system subunit M n=1 Tax=Cellulosimicrobium cellulans TaxID=1710 RepID=UPI002404A6BC|nr:class I SAM-dependent DNA methyltransferase [Cellulosimicrobium cellulans]MDF9874889.1 type I restriction enzyme M protein [Cellulosimicrobium cellulans]
MSQPLGFQDKVAFVWKVADKLRGNFKQHEYGSIMLPLLVLRRLDAVLEPTKAAVLRQVASYGDKTLGPGEDFILQGIAKVPFYNTSPLTFRTLLADDKNVADNLLAYVNALSPSALQVMERYDLAPKVVRMDAAGVLYQVLSDFADLPIGPDAVSNEAMGHIFEELLRKFSEMSNETAGEHYTPREVIRLVVDLLLSGRTAETIEGATVPVRTVYDPAAGTGGMLTTALDRIQSLNTTAKVQVFGQELNPETWAIAQSDLLIQDVGAGNMALGNSLTQDAHPTAKFDYMLANPPYGVDWKSYAKPIHDEASSLGFAGRFGAGLPRVSDGSFLFLQHMIAKMKQGSRIGIVLSGSPLFSGGAGSGESEIRRWIIESDWLEGIVALPDQMFYNTGISTYVWILTNAKPEHRAGKVALVDGREMFTKMRKSLGDKRKYLTDEAIDDLVQLYDDVPLDDPRVKVLANEAFGFQRLTVERPLRRRWEVTPEVTALLPDDARPFLREGAAGAGQGWASEKEFKSALADVVAAATKLDVAIDAKTQRAIVKAAAVPDPGVDPVLVKGSPAPDPDLRDYENIPLPAGYLDMTDEQRAKALREAAENHLRDEIHPYVPDAWIDHAKTKIGYEIPFTRQFYVYSPPRPVDEIAGQIRELESQIQEWMKGLGL